MHWRKYSEFYSLINYLSNQIMLKQIELFWNCELNQTPINWIDSSTWRTGLIVSEQWLNFILSSCNASSDSCIMHNRSDQSGVCGKELHEDSSEVLLCSWVNNSTPGLFQWFMLSRREVAVCLPHGNGWTRDSDHVTHTLTVPVLDKESSLKLL